MKKNLIDLHTHSVLSRHAYSSFTENIEYASSIGLNVYGISEHQPDDVGVGAHKFAFSGCYRSAPKQVGNTKILVGIELNILDDDFNLFGINPNNLSYCIASMHEYAYPHKLHDYYDNTKNYIRAIETPYVKFLGHIDSELYQFDYEKVIKACKDNDKFIELNNSSLNPYGYRKNARDIDKELLSLCIKYNVPVIMNSDAHIKYDIGNVDFSIDLLNEVNFPDELVINYNIELFEKYFNYR